MPAAVSGLAAILGYITVGLAIGTFAATTFFNFRQHALAARKQDIDYRAHQLALLDKRLAVLAVMTNTLERASFHMEPREDNQDRLFVVLLAGQTLFDDRIAERLRNAWTDQVRYLNARTTRRMTALSAAGKLDTGQDDRLDVLRKQLFETVRDLQKDMIEATRVPTQ